MRTYLKKTGLFIIVATMLSLITAFCIGATVISQTHVPQHAQKMYDSEMGQEYVKAVRAFLAEAGYRNSGVTLSRITEADSTMTYTVTIHHTRISELSVDEQKQLKLDLAALPAPKNISTVYHEFLILNN